jgi:hypothetical protein
MGRDAPRRRQGRRRIAPRRRERGAHRPLAQRADPALGPADRRPGLTRAA